MTYIPRKWGGSTCKRYRKGQSMDTVERTNIKTNMPKKKDSNRKRKSLDQKVRGAPRAKSFCLSKREMQIGKKSICLVGTVGGSKGKGNEKGRRGSSPQGFRENNKLAGGGAGRTEQCCRLERESRRGGGRCKRTGGKDSPDWPVRVGKRIRGC